MSVAYADTNVNISIIERANQNVTFAENFDLVESITGDLIEGFINVSNPGSEPVYDILLRLKNMSNLETNVTWVSGRNGSQSVGLDSTPDQITYGVINYTPQPFIVPHDLDHDNRSDFLWINETHLVMDFSSEEDLITFFLAGGPTDQISWSLSFTDQPITLSNGETVGYFNGSGLQSQGQIDPGNLVISEAPNADFVVLHIPELMPGNYTFFSYNATSIIDPPMNVDTWYTHEQLTKVLANECFNVTQNATNDFFNGKNLTNVNISMDMQSVDWNGSVYNFTFDELLQTGDWRNVSNSTNRSWSWAPAGGNLTWGNTETINFSVCAPETVPNSSTYMFLQEQLRYETEGTITGIELADIKARADVAFNFTKRIDKPATTLDDRVVTWESEPTVGTRNDITFNVTKVSMWVTYKGDMDPNNMDTLYQRYFPKQLVNRSDNWNSFEDISTRWYFNYTDGSHPTAPPPVIWMMPYYHIADYQDQIQRTFRTESGEDYYFKYIYVVNGYWLEIEKNVTNIGPDQYNVSLFVWNRGPGFTPRNLTVTIYDFVPEDFTPFQFNPGTDQNTAVSGAFNGTAYLWNVPTTRTIQNASFAPKGQSNSTWNATYLVNGTGDYRLSDLYIVGLDPRLVDGGSSSEVISVLSSMASSSTETMYVMIVLALVAINVVNYAIAKRRED